MPSIGELLEKTFAKNWTKEDEDKFKQEQKLRVNIKSERVDVLSQIYPIYRESTKVENWKRYIKWLKENRFKNSTDKIAEFKKTPIHLKTRTTKSFAIMLAHIPTKDLYYILSVAKDKSNRKENFSGWLMGEVYKK